VTEPEYPTLAKLVKYAVPGKLFVDVGAHHGLFSIEMHNRGMIVSAVEPFPDNVKEFHTQTMGLGIPCHPYALSDIDGNAPFYNGGPSTVHSLVPKLAQEMFGHQQPAELPPPITVRTVRWGTFCKECGISEVEVLKTDAKWSNLQVLTGMSQEGPSPRVICTEMRPADTTEITELLLSLGYAFRDQIMLDGGRNIYDAIWARV